MYSYVAKISEETRNVLVKTSSGRMAGKEKFRKEWRLDGSRWTNLRDGKMFRWVGELNRLNKRRMKRRLELSV